MDGVKQHSVFMAVGKAFGARKLRTATVGISPLIARGCPGASYDGVLSTDKASISPDGTSGVPSAGALFRLPRVSVSPSGRQAIHLSNEPA